MKEPLSFLSINFEKKQILKSSKWGHLRDVYGTQLRNIRGPNDGRFWGRLQDVAHICFLNSTQKDLRLTLTGYTLW